MVSKKGVLGALDEPGMKEVRPGVWHLRVFAGRRPNGSPVQLRKTVDTGTGRVGAGVREARVVLVQMRAEVEESGSKRKPVTAGYTVAKLLDRYIDHCEQHDRSPTTVHEYRRIADKVLIPRLGHTKLADLDQDDLDALYREMKIEGKKATTIRRVHALMSAALRFGQKKRLTRENPANLASPPPIRPAEVEAPTVEQVREIITKAEERDPLLATLLLVASLTGARRGELCGLRWSDIDFRKRTMTIERAAFAVPDGSWGLKDPKTHQMRRVGLDPVTLEALRRHRRDVQKLAEELDLDLPADAFVFSESPQGREPLHPNLVTSRTRKVTRDAGVTSAHFHSLRHFHATQAIAGGFDPVTVSQRLGHADPSVTLRVYAHAVEQRDRDLADALGQQFALGDG